LLFSSLSRLLQSEQALYFRILGAGDFEMHGDSKLDIQIESDASCGFPVSSFRDSIIKLPTVLSPKAAALNSWIQTSTLICNVYKPGTGKPATRNW
jgi:hypothetical protein